MLQFVLLQGTRGDRPHQSCACSRDFHFLHRGVVSSEREQGEDLCHPGGVAICFASRYARRLSSSELSMLLRFLYSAPRGCEQRGRGASSTRRSDRTSCWKRCVSRERTRGRYPSPPRSCSLLCFKVCEELKFLDYCRVFELYVVCIAML